MELGRYPRMDICVRIYLCNLALYLSYNSSNGVMKIEVSNGELLDKLSILKLKLENIVDQAKLENIQKEFDILNPLAQELFKKYDIKEAYEELSGVNEKLWFIEDWLRNLERTKCFNEEFIELARSVYFTNDKRSECKKKINILTNSDIVEEKSYQDYT